LEGANDGKLLGLLDGRFVGYEDGLCDGIFDGTDEGSNDGAAVGEYDGVELGGITGELVGLDVGLGVIISRMYGVGFAVGNLVPTTNSIPLVGTSARLVVGEEREIVFRWFCCCPFAEISTESQHTKHILEPK